MNVNLGRMKKWDWGSSPRSWSRSSASVSLVEAEDRDLFGGLEDALGDLGGLAGTAVPACASTNALGWDIDAGVAAFVFALFCGPLGTGQDAAPADRSLPKWYMEAWPVMVIAASSRYAVSSAAWTLRMVALRRGRGDGSLITLIAGLVILACGYFMFKTDRRLRPVAGAQDQPDDGRGHSSDCLAYSVTLQ